MMLDVRPVQIPDIYKVWDTVAPLLKRAEEKYENPEYGIEHVKSMLISGQFVLFVFLDSENNIHGAIVVTFINYPNDRVAFIIAMGGKGIVEEDTADKFADICKAYGATTIHGVVTKSGARLYQSVKFNERAILVERRL